MNASEHKYFQLKIFLSSSLICKVFFSNKSISNKIVERQYNDQSFFYAGLQDALHKLTHCKKELTTSSKISIY